MNLNLLFRVMRLLMLFWVVGLLHVSATTFSQTVTLRGQSIPLDEVFDNVRKQTGFDVYGFQSVFRGTTPVSIDAKAMPLIDFLTLVLNGQPISAEIKDHSIVLTRRVSDAEVNGLVTQVLSSAVLQQTVAGKIVDENGNALKGATIRVKGSGQQTTTSGEDGVFNLQNVKSNATLIVSYIGYKSVENPVKSDFMLITLNIEPSALDGIDVVSTGYQQLSKERSAGSFSKVSGKTFADRIAISGGILDGLEGLTSGFSINQSEGQDKYLVRGTTSVNSNRSPLYVVDGVPLSASNLESLINDHDIENVTILKDAVASSIWGAQAANGVIVVTTKKGSNTDGKPTILYSNNYTFSGKQDHSYTNLMNSADFIQAAQEVFDPTQFTWNNVTSYSSAGGAPIVYPHELVLYDKSRGIISEAEAMSRLAALAGQDGRSDYERYFLQNQTQLAHNLSIRGGNTFHRYFGSFKYESKDSYNRDATKRYVLNTNQIFDITNKLKFDLTTNIGFTNDDYSNKSTISNLPYARIMDEEGNVVYNENYLMYPQYRELAESRSRISLAFNPIDELSYGFNRSRQFTARVNTGVKYELVKGLNFESRYQYLRGAGKSDAYSPAESYKVRLEQVNFTVASTTGGAPTYYMPSTGGHWNNTIESESEWTVRNQLNFDRSFAEGKHQFNALLGNEIRAHLINTTARYQRGYNPQTLTYVAYNEAAVAAGISSPVIPLSGTRSQLFGKTLTEMESETRFVSFYANAGYTYDRKYIVNGSIRVDQSNLFGTDPSIRFKPIWSLGAAWIATNESYLAGVNDVFDQLKFRASVGLGGNTPGQGIGGPVDIISAGSNAVFNGVGISYSLLTPANDKLNWEKTLTKNFGVDFQFNGSLLSGSIDVYHKKTTDLLGVDFLNPVGGFSTALRNLGDMENKGFEVTLSSHIVNTTDFSWDATLALTHNRNKVLVLKEARSPSVTSRMNQLFVEGYPAFALPAFRWAGLNAEGNPGVFNTDMETIAYRSLDLTDVKAMKNEGSTQPIYFGGFNNVLRYRDLQLSFLVVYNLGHAMRNSVNTFYQGRLTTNIHNDFARRWRQPGDENNTNIPKYIPNASASSNQRFTDFYRYADINVLSASYVKLRDITLSYTVDRGLTTRIGLGEVNVRGSVSNLATWTANDRGLDPESQNLRTGERLPHFKPSYVFGLNVHFN